MKEDPRLVIANVDPNTTDETPLVPPTLNYDPDQPRDEQGKWTDAGGGGGGSAEKTADDFLRKQQGTLASHPSDVKETHREMKGLLTRAGFKKTSTKMRDIGRGTLAATVTEERWARGKKSYILKIGRGRGPHDNYLESIAVNF